jgi:tetratricopeptide (TPR) repeat protein
MLVKERKLGEAIRRCETQLAKRPDNAFYHVFLGRLHAMSKKPDDARKHFKKALEIDPNSRDALFSLARLEQSLGSLDEALAKYERLRESNPKNVGIALLTATLYEQTGQLGKAKPIYEDILAQNPNIHSAANNLAFYYAEMEPTEENLDKAERLMEPLLEKFKDNVNIVDTAAWVAYRKGEYKKALSLLEGIDEKARSMPVVQYHMGMMYLREGQKARAKEMLTLALEDKTPFPGRAEADRTLRELTL